MALEEGGGDAGVEEIGVPALGGAAGEPRMEEQQDAGIGNGEKGDRGMGARATGER